jgi:hypothetical protein
MPKDCGAAQWFHFGKKQTRRGGSLFCHPAGKPGKEILRRRIENPKPLSFEGMVEITKKIGLYWFDIVRLPPMKW